MLDLSYYPGGSTLEDLIIIEGVNYFGKATHQIDDPMGDIGFTFSDGRKIRSECISKGKDIIGQEEYKLYEVYRGNFDLIPDVNGGVKICHWGGAKVGQFGVRALERAALK